MRTGTRLKDKGRGKGRTRQIGYRTPAHDCNRAGLTVSQIMLAVVVAMSLHVALAPATAAQKTLRIVALGDSLTAGYGLAGKDRFASKLQAALRARGHTVEVADAGVSGDTASGGLSRLDWAVPPGTDAVIVELGSNDALRGVDPPVTRAALDQIIGKLKARKIEVLLAGMRAPPNMGPVYERAFNALYPALAEAHGVVFYPFFLDGVAAVRHLNQDDGMHPNARGVDAIVKKITPFAERLIARVTARRQAAQ